jgi:hypothetical protein
VSARHGPDQQHYLRFHEGQQGNSDFLIGKRHGLSVRDANPGTKKARKPRLAGRDYSGF